MFPNEIVKMQNRLMELGWELMYADAQAKIDPEFAKRLPALRREARMLEKKLDAFYSDHMTQECGL